jgi:PAS domain S-box-containing protein
MDNVSREQTLNKITTTNLTHLRNSHDAARVELERYKLLVESIEDYAIFLMDTTGHIQTWNKGAQKNKGYRADEIIGKHFSNFYLPEDKAAKKPERELELAMQLGRVEDEDWRVRKDGSKFWANVVITTLYDTDGKHVGFAKVTRDLTERKQNEDTLRQNNAALKQQQRELEALNVSKDEFISLASHQLRTPATAIKQLLGMLIQGFFGDVEPKHLALITRAYECNDRQINIVNNLLKVAQVDAGKVVLRKSPTDLAGMLSDIAEEQAESLKNRRQRVRLTLPNDSVKPVMVDTEHFRMAISNIVDNASKYSHQKSDIELILHSDSKSAIISIQDAGVGIAEEDIPLLFEKFSRIPNELSEKVGGSGLGLYWVQRVIDMHGGTIEVISKPGKGTTFSVHMPAEPVDA